MPLEARPAAGLRPSGDRASRCGPVGAQGPEGQRRRETGLHAQTFGSGWGAWLIKLVGPIERMGLNVLRGVLADLSNSANFVKAAKAAHLAGGLYMNLLACQPGLARRRPGVGIV